MGLKSKIERSLGSMGLGRVDDLSSWLSERVAALDLREDERKRRESLPPLFVAHLVHGTYARKSEWPDTDSSFSADLRERLGSRARIETFRWTGKNSVKGRLKAAGKFRAHLKDSFKAYPDASHVVVGHSHGGSVAFMAVDSPEVAEKLLGVVTLATPFLSAQARSSKDLIDLGTGLFASLFGGWAVLSYGLFKGLGWGLWPWALGASAALMAVLSLAGWTAEQMQKHGRKLIEWMPASSLTPKQVAIVRMNGDEAIAALAGARLAGSIGNLVWNILSARAFSWMEDVLEWFDFGMFRSTTRDLESSYLKRDYTQYQALHAPDTQQFLSKFGVSDHGSGQLWEPPKSFWERHSGEIKPVLWQGAAGSLLYAVSQADLVTQKVAMVIMGVYALPAALALMLVVVGLPVGLVTAISLLPCGFSAGLAGPYLDLSAEPVPAGEWSVHQFKSHLDDKGLAHSKAYESSDVRAFVADWVLERAISSGALDPRSAVSEEENES